MGSTPPLVSILARVLTQVSSYRNHVVLSLFLSSTSSRAAQL